MIPRLIHQIYLSGDLPSELDSNVTSIKQMNAGWEHRLYDDKQARAFIIEHFGNRVLKRYDRIDPMYGAAKADLLRQLLIFIYGGVYLDIKSYTEKPLQSIIMPNDSYLLSQWTDNGVGQKRAGFGLHPELKHIKGGEFQIFHIIAQKGHPFTKAVIKRILHNIDWYMPWNSVGRTGVLRTTGPIAYTLAIYPLLDKHSYRFIDYLSCGLSPSIDYNHFSIFKSHYSLHEEPVVKLSPLNRRLSFHLLRARKRYVGLRNHLRQR